MRLGPCAVQPFKKKRVGTLTSQYEYGSLKTEEFITNKVLYLISSR